MTYDSVFTDKDLLTGVSASFGVCVGQETPVGEGGTTNLTVETRSKSLYEMRFGE